MSVQCSGMGSDMSSSRPWEELDCCKAARLDRPDCTILGKFDLAYSLNGIVRKDVEGVLGEVVGIDA